MRLAVSAVPLAFLLSACVGADPYQQPIDSDDDMGSMDDDDDDSGRPGDDEVPGDDDPGDEPDPAACPSADFGAVAQLQESAAGSQAADENDPNGPKVHFVYGMIDEVAGVELDLWDGYGAFGQGAAGPGNFTIAGADADPAECGVCMYLFSNEAGTERVFLATAGSVDVQSITGTFVASGQNLEFEELDLATGALMDGGCGSRVGSVSFNAPVAQP